MTIHESPTTVACCRRPFPHLAGIAPRDERTLENRLKKATQGMMHYPITKRCRRNDPPLGLPDLKEAIPRGTPPAFRQLLTQLQEVPFTPLPPTLNVRSSAFSFPRSRCRRHEIPDSSDGIETKFRQRSLHGNAPFSSSHSHCHGRTPGLVT